MDPVTLALILAGSIIIVGFLGNYIFERTGFPDIVLLVVLGIAIGPIAGLVNAQTVVPLTPYFAALALVFILFDGGMAMNIYRVFAESPRAVVLAFVGFGFNVTLTTLFMHYIVFSFILPQSLPELSIFHSMLFGTILGGSSSVVVISLSSKIGVSEKCSTILGLESALTDILCIVFSLVIIEVILKGSIDPVTVGQSIASRFSTGIVLGVALGLVWLSMLKRIDKAPYSYILTLAVVLLAYALSELLGGSGSLCALLFGMMLGNEREIYRIFKMERPSMAVVDTGLKRFESEIAFLLRTFFFVYIGLIVSVGDIKTILIGVILSLILLSARFVAVKIATARCSELAEERPIMSVLLTRGLAAAVLATLPMQYTGENPVFNQIAPLYVNITVLVILATALIASVGIPVLKRDFQKV